MRSLPSDPDIQTIVKRIEDGDIDLQPNFQRGEVWGRSKQQRLIDTILRDWHIPPIHVIESSDSNKQEVLDGQQRLAAIRDFVRGEFAIAGYIEPIDERIKQLDGMKYRDLPPQWRRHVDKFTIRVFRIVDFNPSEPGELFFRLNQPTSLTAAEQRNAYFGPVRQQIKRLVDLLEQSNLDKEFFGFSNSRMAYDDVLARVALTVERGTLAEKVTSTNLADLYRGTKELSIPTLNMLETAISIFRDLRREKPEYRFSFNKATVFSWFMFVIRGNRATQWRPSLLGDFLDVFEGERVLGIFSGDSKFAKEHSWPVPMDRLIIVYESRATSRVADVSSVLLRDAVVWQFFRAFVDWKKIDQKPWTRDFAKLNEAFASVGSPFDEDNLAKALIDREWGRFR